MLHLIIAVSAYVYILRCADQRLYYGSTSDLVRRLGEHRRGRVRTTSARLPIELVYYEVLATPDEARQRERSLKNGRTRRKAIARLIEDFDPRHLAPFA